MSSQALPAWQRSASKAGRAHIILELQGIVLRLVPPRRLAVPAHQELDLPQQQAVSSSQAP